MPGKDPRLNLMGGKNMMKKRHIKEEAFAVWHFTRSLGLYPQPDSEPRWGCCHSDHDNWAEAMNETVRGQGDLSTHHSQEKPDNRKTRTWICFYTPFSCSPATSVVVSDWLTGQWPAPRKPFSFYHFFFFFISKSRKSFSFSHFFFLYK